MNETLTSLIPTDTADEFRANVADLGLARAVADWLRLYAIESSDVPECCDRCDEYVADACELCERAILITYARATMALRQALGHTTEVSPMITWSYEETRATASVLTTAGTARIVATERNLNIVVETAVSFVDTDIPVSSIEEAESIASDELRDLVASIERDYEDALTCLYDPNPRPAEYLSAAA
jgi:hypothetical protein